MLSKSFHRHDAPVPHPRHVGRRECDKFDPGLTICSTDLYRAQHDGNDTGGHHGRACVLQARKACDIERRWMSCTGTGVCVQYGGGNSGSSSVLPACFNAVPVL